MSSSSIVRLALKLCQPTHGSVDKSKRRLMLRVVQFVSVFCDWGKMNPDYLHSVTSTSTLLTTPMAQALDHGTDSNHLSLLGEVLKASGELLRAENRTRSSLRVTVADMKAYLSKLFNISPSAHENKLNSSFLTSSSAEAVSSTKHVFGHGLSLPLPEYIELRGYTPLSNYEVSASSLPHCQSAQLTFVFRFSSEALL
jgi:hypothetical protein